MRRFLPVLIGFFLLAATPARSQSFADNPLPASPAAPDNDYVAFDEPVPLTVSVEASDLRTGERLRSDSNVLLAFNTTTANIGTPFQGTLSFVNTLGTSGGPYNVTNVTMTLSKNSAIQVNSFSGQSYFSCTTEPTQFRCTAGSFPANNTESIVVIMQATTAGSFSFNLSSSQDDYDPNTGNNSVSSSVTVVGPSITGNMWEDLNGNGVQDPGELGVSDRCFYNDADNDNFRDSGETSTTTDSNGDYQFSNLTNGTYYIRQCPGASVTYFASVPDQGVYQVDISGSSVTSKDWITFRPIRVTIPKWQDMNGNGVRDEGDAGVPDWTLSLSGESNVLASYNTTLSVSGDTDSNGDAVINDIRPGTWTLSESQTTGWNQSYPGNWGTISVDLTSGQNLTHTGFGNWQIPAPLSLRLTNDANENGSSDIGEVGISGITFFLDKNGNAILDDGEVSGATNTTGIVSLQPNSLGTQSACTSDTSFLNPISPAWSSGSWCQDVTFASGDDQKIMLFYATPAGVMISGTVWEDFNGDGIRDSGDDGVANMCIFNDADNDGVKDDGETEIASDATGAFRYGPVIDGVYHLRSCSDTYFTTSPDNGVQDFTIAGEPSLNYEWIVVRPATVNVPKWHDFNGNGTRDEGDAGIPGWQMSLTGSQPIFTAYNTTQTQIQTTGNTGIAVMTDLRPGTVSVTESSQALWTQSFPGNNGAISVEITSGATLDLTGFGNWKKPGNLIVQFINDLDGNGQLSAGEGALTGYTFFIDVNLDGTLGTGEVSGVTDGDGYVVLSPPYPGTYPVCTTTTVVTPVSPANPNGGAWCVNATTISDGSPQIFTFFGTGPPVVVEGYKWADLDGDGEEDSGEPRLNGVTINLLSGGAVVASVETADLDRNADGQIDPATERGWYQFVIAEDGVYAIAEVVPDGMQGTYPAGGSHNVTITGLQSPAIAYPFGNFIAALDWGDLPDPYEGLAQDCPLGEPINCYKTLAGVQGAAHMISATSVRLGQRVDAEVDGQPNDTATGDDDNISSQGAEDDEDGLLSFSVDGTGRITLEIDVSGAGFLDAYADVNNDGVLNDGILGGSPLEAFFSSQPIVNGINILQTPEGTVPAYADIRYIRLRVSSAGGLGASGLALDGEVEDYRVAVQKPQAVNSSADTGDANPGDGVCADADGNCSLRAAIEEANASGQPFRLDFTTLGKSAVTVTPTSALPTFQVPIWVQAGGELTIDGSQAGAGANGLTVGAAGGGSFISGVEIVGFDGDGVRIEGGNGSTVSSSRIHGNGGNGVSILAGTGNRISESVLYDNGGLGIDLGDDGVTANDADDADSGVNGLFNAPELTLVTAENGYIEGFFYAEMSSDVTIDLFSSVGCDPSGNGEGETFLTSVMVSSLSAGRNAFTATLADPLPIGAIVTATATDAHGNTSEFSSCFVSVTTDIEREEVSTLPDQFLLDQNYPNPFNPVTTIRFNVARTERVQIAVYDMLGKRVAGLVDRVMEPGAYSVSFDAADLPSGQYVYTMQAGGFRQTRTLTLLK